MKPKYASAISICIICILIACDKTNAQPVINSFTPASGPIGTIVTIQGKGFSETPDSNIIYFGAVRAAVTTTTDTSLIVTVPAGTTFQPITVTKNNLTAYSYQPFIVTFSGDGLMTSNSFQTKIDFESGAYPSSLCLGDFDADGKIDVATTNYTDNTISIFRNTGTKGILSFAPKLDYAALDNPAYVSIGDLDGDGKLDLVVASTVSKIISVFKNTSLSGTISFAEKIDFPAGTYPVSVSIADLNADGKPDLIVANNQESSISIFKNTTEKNGIISFAAKADYPSGISPYGISINDFTEDGKPDLAVSNQYSNSVSVFRNTSSGETISFAAKKDFNAATEPYGISSGDLDGDGKPDIVVTSLGSDSISILRNTNTDSSIVSFANKIDYFIGTSPREASINDLNGDGKNDISIASSKITASVLKNMSAPGTISFASPLEYDIGASSSFVSNGDLDGDGRADLIIANSTRISVLRNIISNPTIISFNPHKGKSGDTITIKGTNFSQTSSVTFGGTSAASFTVVSATRIEAIVGEGSTGSISVTTLLGTAVINGFTYLPQQPPLITSFIPSSGAIGTVVTIEGTHFNPDATKNIVYFGAVRATVLNATETSLNVIVPTGATYQPITVTTDSLTTYSNKPFIVTFSDGDTVFTSSSFASEVEYPTQGEPYVIAISDIDGDGKSDIVFSNASSYTMSVLRNTSSASTISFAPELSFPVGSFLVGVAIGDINGDGKPDVAVANYGSNTASIFKNTSTSGIISFSPKQNFETAEEPYGIAINDLDGDGKPDIVTASNNSFPGTISVLRNTSTNGTISFAPKIDYETGVYPRRVAISDLDGDYKPDLVIANQASSSVSVLRNISTNGAISFSAKIDFATTTGSSPESVSIGDLDEDGKPDIVVANNNTTGTITILKNKSTPGTISFGRKIDLPTEIYPYDVSIGDLNGDGEVDLAVANQLEPNIVSLFKNTSISGKISFTSKVDYPTKRNHQSIALADLDGDGKSDIAFGNDVYSVSVLRNAMGSVLPLNLVNFYAKLVANQAQLQWQTVNEQNTAYFAVEYSADGIAFSTIDTVIAVHRSTINNYKYMHTIQKNGINYYRLKIVDADAKFTYSNIIKVQLNNSEQVLTLYPNPAKKYVIVEHPTTIKFAQIKLINVNGKVVQTLQVDKNALQTRVNIEGVTPGAYFIVWTDGINTKSKSVIVE